MIYKLRITFGGLCMFVNQKSGDSGLYVLMPTSGTIEEHCPVMITWAENDHTSHKNWLVPIAGKSADLTKLTMPGSAVPLPSGILAISRFAGHTPVAPDFLKHIAAPDRKILASQVVLPLGTGVSPFGDPGIFLVPGLPNPMPFYGRVTTEITVTDPAAYPLHIFGETLYPSADVIDIQILNVPYAEIVDPSLRYASKKNDIAHHAQRYYSLIGAGGGAPPIRKWEDRPAQGKPSTKPCPTTRIEYPVSKAQKGVMGVDPLNCTVGGGCPVTDPDC